MDAFRTRDEDLDLDSARAALAEELHEAMESIYARALDSALVQQLLEDRVTFFPATAEVITDDPNKLLNRISAEHQTLVTRMAEVVANAASEVIVVAPYFIPGEAGVEFWRNLTDRGVRVVVVTNSLASNNHIPVHAAYARYRHAIIRAGVELYEMRVDATNATDGKEKAEIESTTLHTKAILTDHHRTFIGSLNLDPRSIDINTEMGVLVNSPEMSGRLARRVLAVLPELAYRVVEDGNGRLRWHGLLDGREVVENSEPQAGGWRRFKAFLSRILPENQL
jgi:putative cardiolipin synthase